MRRAREQGKLGRGAVPSWRPEHLLCVRIPAFACLLPASPDAGRGSAAQAQSRCVLEDAGRGEGHAKEQL